MSDRVAWNKGQGLPQLFRIGDVVRVRQDGGAPLEWSADWAKVRLCIVGTIIDEHHEGRVRYFVHAEDSQWREHDPMAEVWLEALPNQGSENAKLSGHSVMGIPVTEQNQ